jgi:stage V sporulation protein G
MPKNTTSPVPKYDVKIHSIRPAGSCKATASVNIYGVFAVRGIKIMEGSKGLFISMPSYKAGNGEYKDICFLVPRSPKRNLTRRLSGLTSRRSLKDRPPHRNRNLPNSSRSKVSLSWAGCRR